MIRTRLGLLALLCACTPDEEEGAPALDLRRDFPDPEPDGVQWVTPEMVIPAYEEREFCTFVTWEGEEVGLWAQATYQSDYGHHVVFLGTQASAVDYPDGTTFDCTDPGVLDMDTFEPIFLSADSDEDGYARLPEGMAARVPSGQRFVMQSHYVNPKDRDILVQDAVNWILVDPDAVETWSAPFVHNTMNYALQPGLEDSVAFDCTWDEGGFLLFLGGHMHEHGTAISVDLTRDGVTERIYEVASWLPEFRDQTPYDDYLDAPFEVLPGDTFTTTCTWFNDSDEVIVFPSEMCVSFGMMYPSKVPEICDAD